MSSSSQSDVTWQPTSTIQSLRFRAGLLRRVRQFFDQLQFFEVQTPCLMPETVVDAHLEPLVLAANGNPANRPLFLQTSPEAGMKRLLAAGAEAIYQLGPVFRADEVGQFHNLEFTMLEWYRRGDSMEDGIQLLADLVRGLLPSSPLETLTYRELFQRELSIDPLAANIHQLRGMVETHEPSMQLSALSSSPWQRDDMLDVLMGLVLQPRLKGLVVVSNYPVSQAALARRSDSDPETAERFELFIDGVEIANGYAELCDADELLARTAGINQRRQHAGLLTLPVPMRLLEAMRAGFPRCSGTALGFDRLVMVAGGYSHISQVLTFPASFRE